MAEKETVAQLVNAFVRLDQCHTTRVPTQISKGENCVLSYLYWHEAASPGDISRAMNVSSARITTVMNVLENRGLLQRTVDRNDRRKINAKLTPKGREYIGGIYDQLHTHGNAMADFLGAEDVAEVIRLLNRVVSFYQADPSAKSKRTEA
jgi:DNA-binding MarR family transcriptional regulator